jgi:hypothetical protein
VTVQGWIYAIFWHRVDVKRHFEIRDKDTDRLIHKWTETKMHKAYAFEEAGHDLAKVPGEADTRMSFSTSSRNSSTASKAARPGTGSARRTR